MCNLLYLFESSARPFVREFKFVASTRQYHKTLKERIRGLQSDNDKNVGGNGINYTQTQSTTVAEPTIAIFFTPAG